MEPIIDEDYPSNCPLEKIGSHLKISLKLLETAQIQWMNEKESLLREIERLRLENRTLRIEARNNENLENMSNTPINNRFNNCFTINQENGKLISVSSNSSHQIIKNIADNSNSQNMFGVSNFINTEHSNVNRNSNSNSRYLKHEHISPATNSQNCRVRRIQLEDEQSDHDSNENKQRTIKYREVGKSIDKKNSRNNLQAFECTECSKFYRTINNNNLNSQNICKHMKQVSLLQNSGRHRYNHPPTKSPPGYWDLDDI